MMHSESQVTEFSSFFFSEKYMFMEIIQSLNISYILQMCHVLWFSVGWMVINQMS